MQEYYIRNPDSDESRGPFTIEQLTSLGETGHITLETYIYNPEEEEWQVLEENEELRASVFPERRRLTTRERGDDDFESLKEEESKLPPVTIDDLLAAAEGTTEETKEKKRETIWLGKAAVLAMYLNGTAFLMSAIGLFLSQRFIFSDFSFAAVSKNPLVIVGAFDLCLSLILFLQTTAVYPLIRFRTMLGSGFALFYFWAVGFPLIGIVVLIGSLGIYGLTLFLDRVRFFTSAALAIVGMAAFIFLTLGI